MVDSATTGDSLPILVPLTQSYTPTTVATGTATLTVSAPGFTPLPQASRTVTVTP